MKLRAIACFMAFSGLVGSAAADEIEELRAQIRALSARLDRLQAERERAPQRADSLPAGERKTGSVDAAVPPPPSLPGAWQIPGTDTAIKVFGYAKLDIYDDIRGANANGSTMNFGTIAIDGTPQAKRRNQFAMTARQSRLGVETLTPTAWGPLKTLIEADFQGAGSTSLETHSATMRLRHLYGQWGAVMAGQNWTNFFDIGMAPETVEFNGPVGVANGLRQPQLRYTWPVGAGGSFSVAAENAAGDFFGADLVSLGTNSTSLTNRTLNRFPDLTGRYSYQAPWGRLTAAAVVRNIAVDTGGATQTFQGPNGSFGFRGKTEAWGGGISLAAQFLTVGKDSFTVQLLGGPGIGRYLMQPLDNAAAIAIAPNGLSNANTGDSFVLDQGGRFHAVPAWGANVWYRHYWSDNLRSTVTYGVTEKDFPMIYLPPNMARRQQSFYLNLIWSPLPQTNFGLEYIWGRVDLEGQTAANRALGYGSSGTMSRLQAGLQYKF